MSTSEIGKGIKHLKNKAREYNRLGDEKSLSEVIKTLDEIWTNDIAAKAFYTELETTRPSV